jgi:hypothetical protein
MKRAALLLAPAVLLFGALAPARADYIWTLNDTQNGVSGTVQFVAVSGGFEMKVINTESNTPDAGHAISQIQFTVGGTLQTPTAFTELKGTETDFNSSPTSVDDKPVPDSAHWPFKTSGSTVSLLDVGGSIGGQPNHLIVAAGSTPNSSLTNTHLPSFIGEVDFFFAATGVPSDFTPSEITNVKLGFGSQPEVPLENLTPQVAVPAPSSLTLLSMAAVTFAGFFGWRRKLAAA